MSTELEFHPLANVFPLMEGEEFDELVADIKANGQHEPVTAYEGEILDGRNRYRACRRLGIEPNFTAYTDDDPVAFAVSLNLRRRHLDESQRAMVAAKLAKLAHGQRQSGQLAAVPTQEEAATLLNVGERSVRRAAEVRDHGAPELAQAVERGDVSVSAAAEIASLPELEQRETLAGGGKAVKDRAKELREQRAKRQAAARKGAEKAAETRRRKQEAKAEARDRELEVIEREMKELASKLITLDREIALAVYQVVTGNWDRRNCFEYALCEGLDLFEDEPDDTSDDTTDAKTTVADTTAETTTAGWIESDTLEEATA